MVSNQSSGEEVTEIEAKVQNNIDNPVSPCLIYKKF